MKRSEMLDIIQKHIDEAQENYGASSNYFGFQISVELLEKIEKAGMRPPFRDRTEHERKTFGTKEDSYDLGYKKQDWDKE